MLHTIQIVALLNFFKAKPVAIAVKEFKRQRHKQCLFYARFPKEME